MSLILHSTVSLRWGTPGQYIIDGAPYFKTLEPPIPVLPAGDYILQIYFSPEHWCYVPRYISLTDPTIAPRCIESHWGNVYLDTKGCTLVGDRFDDINCAEIYPAINPRTGQPDPRHSLGIIPGILDSKATWKMMMSDGKIDFGQINYGGKVVSAKNLLGITQPFAPDEYYTGGTPITVIRAAA